MQNNLPSREDEEEFEHGDRDLPGLLGKKLDALTDGPEKHLLEDVSLRYAICALSVDKFDVTTHVVRTLGILGTRKHGAIPVSDVVPLYAYASFVSPESKGNPRIMMPLFFVTMELYRHLGWLKEVDRSRGLIAFTESTDGSMDRMMKNVLPELYEGIDGIFTTDESVGLDKNEKFVASRTRVIERIFGGRVVTK